MALPDDVSFRGSSSIPVPLPRDFTQIFGLHPGMALMVVIVDTMLFGGEAATLGASFPISVMASIVIGIITYRAQMSWYGDKHDDAVTKAWILAFLTAIPTPLPALFYIPAGILGLFRRK